MDPTWSDRKPANFATLVQCSFQNIYSIIPSLSFFFDKQLILRSSIHRRPCTRFISQKFSGNDFVSIIREGQVTWRFSRAEKVVLWLFPWSLVRTGLSAQHKYSNIATFLSSRHFLVLREVY